MSPEKDKVFDALVGRGVPVAHENLLLAAGVKFAPSRAAMSLALAVICDTNWLEMPLPGSRYGDGVACHAPARCAAREGEHHGK
jgi:hypothetical protein